MTYFAPEAAAAFKAAGYRGFWMGYFAGRAAPLGAAPAELVHALFYNFDLAHVARAIPDAWSFAGPEVALTARLDGATTALRRCLGPDADGPGVDRVVELVAKASEAAPIEGRPLYAANRALAIPGGALERLWHHATLLREHRGDGHVAALTTYGLSGRQAHVLHALASGTPVEVYQNARTFTPDDWNSILDQFRIRALVDAKGALTPSGYELKDTIEQRTDELAASAYATLSEGDIDTLIGALTPLAHAVVAAGDLPRKTPMGLDLDEVGKPI